ncbi:sigma-E factor negative regulatory protein [Gilvimarinus agarilyticus]|uniref:sigma-E factor negative regulatory protein n=1 Tax=unclassified Gilvimarinus TaxID=2642066 RepID=UPI001C09FCC8|nr:MULTISPECIES: sigma-E factor negative regulatory protein [unclassified Gilvimarinus]MBU2884690.1 sigma-E factor negative regulatory protein [Gilvimarinus agarilyticus]MDO6569798.1 sigma-E factor negative regulatory protein [Gilvimarinus sp. 2_MG-2023]MDO6747388.1 sigma-E factor negative regulatory protein [Gilvimarinus sp. 1_MG-2023]
MTDTSHKAQLAESVSAMVDGEASELEFARILKSSGEQPDVQATWSRYQVASSAIRSDLPPQMAPEGFAASLSAALEDEPTVTTGRLSRVWRGMGQAAIAASVAGALVVGAQFYQGEDLTAEIMADATPAEKTITAADVSLPVGFNAPALPTRQVSAQSVYQPATRRPVVVESRRPNVQVSSDEVKHYLHQLLEQHTDQAAVNSASGIVPHARVPLIEEE